MDSCKKKGTALEWPSFGFFQQAVVEKKKKLGSLALSGFFSSFLHERGEWTTKKKKEQQEEREEEATYCSEDLHGASYVRKLQVSEAL